MKILTQLSVIEGLVREIHPPSSLDFSSPSEITSRYRQPDVVHPSECDKVPDTKLAVLTLNLDASFRVGIDKILQWPVLDRLLSPLRKFRFVDFRGTEVYTYLDDLFMNTDTVTSPGLLERPRDSSTLINISTERSDIEPLIDNFFNRVNAKNPILSRQAANHYCQQYYEHGPLFNLETCLVLLTCALGAVSMEFDPLDVGESPSSSSHSSSRLASLELGYRYFMAAEKRLGSAISNISTLAIQCFCLAG